MSIPSHATELLNLPLIQN